MTTDEQQVTVSLEDWAAQIDKKAGPQAQLDSPHLEETFVTELARDQRGAYLAILGWDILGFGTRVERYGFLRLGRRTVYTLAMLAPKCG